MYVCMYVCMYVWYVCMYVCMSNLWFCGSDVWVAFFFFSFRVMECSESNRMHAQNLAIVWGPNLMWPKYETGNIAIQMVHQNQITEFLLLEMDAVLK